MVGGNAAAGSTVGVSEFSRSARWRYYLLGFPQLLACGSAIWFVGVSLSATRFSSVFVFFSVWGDTLIYWVLQRERHLVPAVFLWVVYYMYICVCVLGFPDALFLCECVWCQRAVVGVVNGEMADDIQQ